MRQYQTTQNKTLFALIVAMIACFALFFSTSNVAFASTGNVAKIGTQEYATFEQALQVAESDTDATVIDLLADVTLATNSDNGKLPVKTSITVNGNGHKITGTQQHMFRIGSEQDNKTTNHDPAKKIEVTFNNVHIINSYTGNAPRVLQTRGGHLELNVNNSILENVGGSGTVGQALTIGGNQLGGYAIDVNVIDSKIIDGQQNQKYGYGIIAYNKVNLDVINSDVIGWSALFMKPADSSQGSKGSVVNINNSQVKAINTHSGATNSFATFVIEDDDITLNIENSTVNASATGDQPQYIVCFQPDFDYSTGTVIEGTQPTGGKVSISGDTVITGIGENDLVVDYRDGTQTEGKAQIVISGGTFDAPIPDEYLADGIVMDGNGNAITFEQKQSDAIAEINNYFDSLSNNVYTISDTEKLNSLKASAIATVTTSVTASAVDNAVATFKTRASAIPTTTVEKLKESGIAQITACYDELVAKNYYFDNTLENLKATAIASVNSAKTPDAIANAVKDFEQTANATKGIDSDLLALLISASFVLLVGIICTVCLIICKVRGIQIVFKNQPVVEEEQPVVYNKKQVKEKTPYQSRAPWVLRELQKQLEEQQAQQTEAEQPAEEVAETEDTVEEVPVAEQQVEEVVDETIVDEQPVAESTNEKADDVVATKTSAFENIANRPSKTFEEKLAESDPEVVASYNLINDTLAQYKNVKVRLSKKCQSYRKGKVLVAKVAIVGKSARLYLALDPNEYATSKYHHKDVSDKKSYATTPLMLRVKSNRSQKYAVELIEQLAEKFGLEK